MSAKLQAEKIEKVVLVTGSARRVGAAIIKAFHADGYRVIVHYRHSAKEADALTASLNAIRPQSAYAMPADLDQPDLYDAFIEQCYHCFNRLDVLIHNASTFTPTPIGSTSLAQWDYLFNSNLKAPFYLSQAAAPFLKATEGSIINIVDIHAISPMKNYTVYNCAKAGLHMLTKSLATELAPHIRVNAVAPGNVIWPENENTYSEEKKAKLIDATLLKRQVCPEDIARTALFLANQTAITAQMIHVDAGKLV